MREKRIRGLRRHWRDHQGRAAIAERLSLPSIEKYQYTSAQLGLSPWSVHGKPPLAFRKLWVSRLVADFHQWHQELSFSHPDAYLAVWLYEPRFGKSQVSAATNRMKIRYEEIFDEADAEADMPLPIEYQSLPGVAALRWTCHAELESFWPDEFVECGAWASSKPHWEYQTPDGETYVAVQVGWVWVGKAETDVAR